MKKRKLRKPPNLGWIMCLDSAIGLNRTIYIAQGDMHLNAIRAESLAKYLLKAAAWLKEQEGEK